MSTEVVLLSRPVNFAVVQMHGRSFPGVVVQGDTLHSLVQRLNALVHSARKGDDEDLVDGLEDIREQLHEAMQHFENVCAQHHIALPYRS